MTAYLDAVEAGQLDLLEALERNGADPDRVADNGANALMLAAMSGQLAALEWLLGNGRDPNATTPKGVNALFLAASRGHTEIVSALLAAGGDPLATAVSEESPLDVAADTETLALLLPAAYPRPDAVPSNYEQPPSGEELDALLAAATRVELEDLIGSREVTSYVLGMSEYIPALDCRLVWAEVGINAGVQRFTFENRHFELRRSEDGVWAATIKMSKNFGE